MTMSKKTIKINEEINMELVKLIDECNDNELISKINEIREALKMMIKLNNGICKDENLLSKFNCIVKCVYGRFSHLKQNLEEKDFNNLGALMRGANIINNIEKKIKYIALEHFTKKDLIFINRSCGFPLWANKEKKFRLFYEIYTNYVKMMKLNIIDFLDDTFRNNYNNGVLFDESKEEIKKYFEK